MKKVFTVLMILLILTGCTKKEEKEIKEKTISINDTIYCAPSEIEYDNCILFHNNTIKIGNFNYYQTSKNKYLDNYKVFDYTIENNKIITNLEMIYDIDTDTITLNEMKYTKADMKEIEDIINVVDQLSIPDHAYCSKSIYVGRKQDYGCMVFNYDGTYHKVFVLDGKIYQNDVSTNENMLKGVYIEYDKNNPNIADTYFLSKNEGYIEYFMRYSKLFDAIPYSIVNDKVLLGYLENKSKPYTYCETILGCIETR